MCAAWTISRPEIPISALLPDVLFTRGDVNDRPKLWTLLQDVDCVYHLAARVSVPESVIYPASTMQLTSVERSR
jgi:nucleoside-diphosphate-sugar epimerase